MSGILQQEVGTYKWRRGFMWWIDINLLSEWYNGEVAD